MWFVRCDRLGTSRAKHRGQRGIDFIVPTGRMTVAVRGAQTLIRFLPVIGKGHDFIGHYVRPDHEARSKGKDDHHHNNWRISSYSHRLFSLH